MGSVLLYMSLAISPSRGDATGMALYRWSWIGTPLLVADYTFLLAGFVLFFTANFWMKVAASQETVLDAKYGYMVWVKVFFPTAVFILLLIVGANVMSLR